MSVLVGLLWALPHAARACSCIQPPPPLEALEQAAAVFEARAVRQRTIEDRDGPPRLEIEFQVARWWKGEVGEVATITTATSSAACGRHFELGETYVLYAYQPEGADDLHDSFCSRTRVRLDADEDIAALGPGQPPRGASPAPSGGEAREPPRIEPTPEPPSTASPRGCRVAGDRDLDVDLELALALTLPLARRVRARRRRERPGPG